MGQSMRVTEAERKMIEAFRNEKSIFNGALAAAVLAVKSVPEGDGYKERVLAALVALRKED